MNIKNYSKIQNSKDIYVPDDLEKINLIMDGLMDGLDDEYNEDDEDKQYKALFKTLNKTIKNQNELNKSTNYKIMSEYLSKLKRTVNGKKTDDDTRLNIVRDLLKDDSHFINLTETFFECNKSYQNRLMRKFVEFPLECMSSYIQGITNSDAYLRRKYFDGQTRKREDGSTYKREYNIFTEADLIQVDEEGKEFSPMDTAEFVDKYFDDAKQLLSVLNEQEKEVLLLMYYLSSGDNPTATIKDITKHSKYSKRQVETIKTKIKYKTLKWLNDNGVKDTYNHYYEFCKKYKNFEENYNKFLKNVKKS